MCVFKLDHQSLLQSLHLPRLPTKIHHRLPRHHGPHRSRKLRKRPFQSRMIHLIARMPLDNLRHFVRAARGDLHAHAVQVDLRVQFFEAQGAGHAKREKGEVGLHGCEWGRVGWGCVFFVGG